MSRVRLLCCTTFVLIGSALSAIAIGQEALPAADTGAAAPRELQYFRVEVPAGREDSWPKLYDFERHPYPIPSEEFQRLLRAIVPARSRSSAALRISTIRGEAKVVDDALIGNLELDVLAETNTRSLLSLAGCNLAIGEAKWADGRPAELGAAPDGSPVLVVEQAGKLQIQWSLRGRRDADGTVRLDLGLPRCQSAQLNLIAPTVVRVSTSHGLLTSQAAVNEIEQRHLLELGSLPNTQIIVAGQSQPSQHQHAWLVRQQCDYAIGIQGLALSTELSLTTVGDSTAGGMLKLRADAGLHLTAALVDGAPLVWEISTIDGAEYILLSIDGVSSTARPAAREVTLTAIGEFPPAVRRALPAIRPLDVVWQSSQATVKLDANYELRSLDVSGGRLVKLTSSPAGGRTANAEFFDLAGRMTLSFDMPATACAARCTYVWRIVPEEIEARCFADLTTAAGAIYELTAAIAPGWQVDENDVRLWAAGVESTTPLVDSRITIERDQIRIVFDAPLTPTRPLRLEVTARQRIDAASGTLRVRDLQFVRWQTPAPSPEIGIATTLAPYRVQLSGGAGPRVAREQISPTALAWVPASAAYAAFAIDGESRGASLAIVRDPPRVEAEVELVVDVDRQQLTETYDVHLRPDTNGVDRLRLNFWPPRTAPLAWTMSTTDEMPVAEFRRVEPTNGIAVAEAPEIWEVKFHQRQTSPLTLHATRSSNMAAAGQTRITLATVEDATSQTGRAVVRSPIGVSTSITNRRMRAIAPPATSGDFVVRGAYRYDSARVMAAGDESLSLALTSPTQQAWAWQLIVESRYSSGAVQEHRATWLVHNDGASFVRVKLPEGSQLRSAVVNGLAVDAQPVASELVVKLPPNTPALRLSVDFSTSTAALGMRRRLTSTAPQIDVPVLRRTWNVTLPEGYQITGLRGASTPAIASATSLRSRLFGTLYRSAANSITRDRVQNSHPANERSNDTRVAAILDRLNAPNATWEQALLDYQLASKEADGPGAALLIDALAVAQLGISPSARVHAAGAADDRSPTASLRAAKLALLIADEGLVLTSAAAASNMSGVDRRGDDNALVTIAAEQQRSAIFDPRLRSAEFVTPQVWASPLSPVRELTLQEKRLSFVNEAADAAAISLDLPLQGIATIDICNRDYLFGVRIATLLLALGVVWCFPVVRISLLFGIGLLAAAIALCLPAPLDAVASGMFLGLLLGAMMRLSPLRVSAPAVAPATGETSTATAAVQLAAWLPWLVAVAMTASHASAAEKNPDHPYPVWIPVNENRVPAGEVYLPKAFYDELRARARAADAAQRGWVLLGADYQLRLAWQESPAVLDADELQIVYDIDVTEPSPTISLPLPYAGLALGSAWATLDGQPIELAWRAEQRTLEVPVDEIGKHRLELRVRPTTSDVQERRHIDLQVPPTLTAKLQVIAPPNAGAVQIDSSLGAVQQELAVLPLIDGGEEKVARWRASIGNVSRISITWPRQAAAAASAAEFTVEQSTWLKLAGEPRLEVKFRCTTKSDALRELVMVAPAELKLVPSTTKWEQVAAASSALAAYRLLLERPADKEVIARAEFQWPSPVAMGRMLLPQVQLRDARSVSSSTLALSLPTGVAVEPGPSLRPLATDEFLRRWGEASASPAHVFQLGAAANLHELLLRPVAARPSSRERLQVSLSQQKAVLELRAEIDHQGAATQIHEISTPLSFSLQRAAIVAVSDGEEPREMLAWSSIESGKLRLFLREPAVGTLLLEVSGSAPLQQGRAELPKLQVDSAQCAARTVDVLRQNDALVTIVASPGFSVADEAEAPSTSESGRRIATLVDEQPAASKASISVKVSPNEARVAGRQITTLLRDEDAWIVRAQWQLEVSAGVVDSLRLQLPPELAMEVTLNPPLTHRFTSGAEGAGRELIVLPDQAVDGAFTITLQARLNAVAGQAVQVPDIRARDLNDLERFLVLPRTIDTQNIEWQVDRLLVLPEDRRKELGFDVADAIVYRVMSEPFHAELRALRRLAGVPVVRLADIRLAWTSDTTCAGWATFDVDPAGLSFCSIAVPADYRLVHVRTGETAAQVQPLSPQRWRIALRPQRLPQRIEVYFQGENLQRAAAGVWQAEGPILEDIAVERTLWTIFGPPKLGPGAPQAGGAVSSAQQDLIRLRSLTEVLRLPRHQRVENTAREMNDWYAPWETRWQALRRDITRAQLQDGAAPTQKALLEDLQAIDADHRQIVAELGELPPSASGSTTSNDVPEFWQFTVARGDLATRVIVQGSSTAMPIAYQHQAPTSDWLLRWAAAVALVLAGIAGLSSRYWLPQGDWQQIAARCGGIALGLAWAAWLWPSWFGWIIALWFLLPLRWPRLRQTSPDAGSAIVVRGASTAARAL